MQEQKHRLHVHTGGGGCFLSSPPTRCRRILSLVEIDEILLGACDGAQGKPAVSTVRRRWGLLGRGVLVMGIDDSRGEAGLLVEAGSALCRSSPRQHRVASYDSPSADSCRRLGSRGLDEGRLHDIERLDSARAASNQSAAKQPSKLERGLAPCEEQGDAAFAGAL